MKKKSTDIAKGQMASQVIVGLLQVSRAQALQLLAQGAVYINGKRLGADVQALAGQRMTVVLEERGRSTGLETERSPSSLEVVFESRELVALNKPAGVVTQPTEGGHELSLLEAASSYCKLQLRVVHRLDRETSGIICFAKNSLTASALSKELKEHRAKKLYVAVCDPNIPTAGVIEVPLSRDPSRPQRWRATHQANGLAALTHFKTIACDELSALVQLKPHTGRTHQLRAHLASLGFPIFGDTLYGGTGTSRCLLHAWHLEIVGLKLMAPLPVDIASHAQRLRVAQDSPRFDFMP
jgi:23S rRNA pseudouridine1911/1915/1917 synthase